MTVSYTHLYNAEAVLEDTIQSVISQTYHHVEYILVDGASKDGTLSIICLLYTSKEKPRGLVNSLPYQPINYVRYITQRKNSQRPLLGRIQPVSYTHLDVYKRQVVFRHTDGNAMFLKKCHVWVATVLYLSLIHI